MVENEEMNGSEEQAVAKPEEVSAEVAPVEDENAEVAAETPPDEVPARILLSADPLALDTHALALMNQLRGELPNVPEAKLGWLAEAARLNLGTQSLDFDLLETG